ncbi:MAG TPA: MCE family protein [Pseudonocardiaceae bacterium]|jgi:virulence factor Mce-like protein|nr:MCE family protein [Pseudonocardiaceae bacterium]
MHGALSTVRRRLLGLLLIGVIAAFLVVTVLFYNQTFTSYVPVTLRADHTGNELSAGSDVKVRGMLVGTVKSVSSSGDGAVIDLALQPDVVDQIPANVSAQLLPKTLFGERYVDLVIPPNDGSSAHIASGAVIGQDRTTEGIEVERVLDDLMPVLQAVQPQKLSVTLTAIATALQGRGVQLGQTLSQLGQYVGQLNPQLPTLEHDLRALTTTANTYNQAAPNLIKALNDLTVTSQTIVNQQNNLVNLYATLSTSADNLDNFLAANKNNLIQVSSASLPTLDVLARYAPEYPCFLKQMANLVPVVDKAFGKGSDLPGLHATLEITVNRGPYDSGTDAPSYSDNRGPRCYDLHPTPSPFPQYAPDGPIDDGSSHPPPARTTNDGLLPPTNAQTILGTNPQSAGSGGGDLANSPAEEQFLAALLAPGVGVSPQDFPGWSSELIGPLFRGTEVTIK